MTVFTYSQAKQNFASITYFLMLVSVTEKTPDFLFRHNYLTVLHCKSLTAIFKNYCKFVLSF